MRRFRTLNALLEALRAEEDMDVLSAIEAARVLGVTKQAIYNRCTRDVSLEAWGCGRVIFISKRSVKKALKKKQGIPEGQRELDIAA